MVMLIRLRRNFLRVQGCEYALSASTLKRTPEPGGRCRRCRSHIRVRAVSEDDACAIWSGLTDGVAPPTE